MTAIVTVALITLGASFLCSLLEAALYTITPSQIELLRERGVRGANRLAKLRRDVEEPIAAILTINTVAHTIGSAWCGAMVGAHFNNDQIFAEIEGALWDALPKSAPSTEEAIAAT